MNQLNIVFGVLCPKCKNEERIYAKDISFNWLKRECKFCNSKYRIKIDKDTKQFLVEPVDVDETKTI